MIAEVLSPSSEVENRTIELDFYRRLPTPKFVLLVWQEQGRVERWQRLSGADSCRSGRNDDIVALPELGCALLLDGIYVN